MHAPGPVASPLRLALSQAELKTVTLHQSCPLPPFARPGSWLEVCGDSWGSAPDAALPVEGASCSAACSAVLCQLG